jgi:hypothetical protein
MLSEIEALNQINQNLVTIGEVQNIILGLLFVFLIYGMYKALSKVINWFI